jgi:putative peptidoglycan lipid II flippase
MAYRRFILKKTIQMSISTLISRCLGLIREILLARFLGAGAAADAFNTAFMLPNTLRKIFAEGALTAALSPTLVMLLRKEGKHNANALTTLTFVIIQGILIVLCILISLFAPAIVWLSAPGFSPEQIVRTTGLARVLIFFIIFASASALLASALQAAQRFFVPANSQVLMNLLFIAQLGLALYYKLPLVFLAWSILFDGIVLVLAHVIAYKTAGLAFERPTPETRAWFSQVMKKFIPCLITAGSMEISLVIDRMMASYLPEGSISLLSYSSAFLRVPLGVFIGGFATILLPRLAHVNIYAPRRLGYYFTESIKLTAWVIIPSMLLMIAFSYKIFSTFLLSKNFTIHDAIQASRLLNAFSVGLFFFALNKIAINVFYALHDTLTPTIITLVGTLCNTGLNYLFMKTYGAEGIAFATSCAAAVQAVFLVGVLHRRYKITLYTKSLRVFSIRALAQTIVFSLFFVASYSIFYSVINRLPARYVHFLLEKVGFWLWVGPLCATLGALMYMTRKRYGIRIYFLD